MREDLKLALLIGFFASLVWVPVLRSVSVYFRDQIWLLMLIIPFMFAFSLYVSGTLFRRMKSLYPFIKYSAVGFFSAGIDFAVFNLLIYATGIERGAEITLFKAASFACGMLNSYNWNRVWTFRMGKPGRGPWHSRRFFRYTVITMFGFAINVGLTSLVANLVSPPFGITQVIWDNLAAVAGTCGSMIWDFNGYKLMVFRPHPVAPVEASG